MDSHCNIDLAAYCSNIQELSLSLEVRPAPPSRMAVSNSGTTFSHMNQFFTCCRFWFNETFRCPQQNEDYSHQMQSKTVASKLVMATGKETRERKAKKGSWLSARETFKIRVWR